MNINKVFLQDLMDDLDELLFDSIIFIFGISEGEYIESLKNVICKENRVFIIEPDNDKYNKYKDSIDDSKIKFLLYKKEIIENITKSLIDYRNFNKLRVHAYGNYSEDFAKEYSELIECIDNAYFNALADLNVSHVFKKVFLQNLISNIDKINNSTSINSYIDLNKNVPAIIVSAGPSLDKNIEIMLKYKDKLKNYFIIAGNRTISSLIDKGIIPNLVVSIDSQHITYEMIENYLEYKIPLLFCEGSNKELIKKYKGNLIYAAQLLPKLVEEIKDYKGLYTGGSVAHACTDFASIMGCNPIIFVGQDLAYTFDKAHAIISKFKKDINEDISQSVILVKDVYGNDIKTSLILNYYRIKFEEYIKIIKINKDIDFYNVSYGADINGASHIELEEIFKTYQSLEQIKELGPHKSEKINPQSIIDYINDKIEYFINKSKECMEICTALATTEILPSLLEIKENDEHFQQFIFAFKTMIEFEQSNLALYINGYVAEFKFNIGEKYFNMTSKDYPKLTSDMKYQSGNLQNYFEDLLVMLEEVKEVLRG